MDTALRALRRVDFEWALRVQQIWSDHERDVAALHRHIRDELTEHMELLSERRDAASPLGIPLVGPAGSGKTHLLSAIRAQAFKRGLFFVLADMTDVADFWDTIVLAYLRSLQQTNASGKRQVDEWLTRLVEKYGEGVRKRYDIHAQRPPGLIVTTNQLLDAIRKGHRAAALEHQDVIRALVLFACDHAELNDLGYKWLQAIGIDEEEREMHGFQVARRNPSQVVAGLSWALGLVAPTVLALDQLDAIVAEHHAAARADLEDPTEQQMRSNAIIQGVAGGLLALRDTTSRTLTIVSALEATWRLLGERSSVSMTDRFEPQLLVKASSNVELMRQLIQKRLEASYGKHDVQAPYAGYPFRPEFFETYKNASPRKLLQACFEHVQLCRLHGRVVEIGDKPYVDDPPPSVGAHRLSAIRTRFQELRASAPLAALLQEDNEDQQDEVLEFAADALLLENPVREGVQAQTEKDFMATGGYASLHVRIRLTLTDEGERERHHAFRFLQKEHYRAFQARLKAAITASGIDHDLSFRGLTIVRTTPPPSGKATQKLLEELTSRGGGLLNPSEDELRTLWAVSRLLAEPDQHNDDHSLERWFSVDRPISQLSGFDAVVRSLFHDLQAPRVATPPVAAPAPSSATPLPAAPTPTFAPPTAAPAPTPATAPTAAPAPHPAPAPTPATARREPPPAGPKASMSARLPVGHAWSSAGPGAPVDLQLGALANHTCVLAGAGSGKTVFLKRIVEEAALLGVPSIVIDGANDLARLGDAWPARPDAFSEDDDQKAARYHLATEVIVWTPGNPLGNPLELDLLPDFSALSGQTSPEGQAELDAAIAMATSSLLPLVAPGTGEKAKKSEAILQGTLQHFARQRGNKMMDFIALLREPPDDVLEPFANGAKMAQNMSELLYSAVKTDPLLSGHGVALDPASLLASPSGKTRVSVINLSGLPGIERQRQFIDRLATTLFTYIKKHPAPKDSLMGLFVLDEAKDFVPSGTNVPGKDNIIRLAAQARKYGLGLLFATQAPKSIDNKAVANCSTLLVGRANSPAAIDTVQELIKDKGGTASDVAKLDRGIFYFSTAPERPRKIATSLCLSYHPSSPPSEAEIVALARRTQP